MTGKSAIDLLDETIAELEARLNLKPDDPIVTETQGIEGKNEKKNNKGEKKQKNKPTKDQQSTPASNDLPDICKLEFKVGKIVNVWVHPEADKLYCEEIDVGEDTPRQIASGLRPHFTLEQMMGQRLLVASNLKPKNLVGFKSHGMVLCAAEPLPDGTGEKVEFVEPPEGAAIGEVVTFEGLPAPQPATPAQVEKRKMWQMVAEGMRTADFQATWNGHLFMTSAGPCRTKTIAQGMIR